MKIQLHSLLLAILILSCGFPTLSLTENTSTQKKGSIEKTSATTEQIAATVNGAKITLTEVENELKQRPEYAMYLTMEDQKPEVLSRLKLSSLNKLIGRALLIEVASKNFSGSTEKLNNDFAKIIEQSGGEQRVRQMLQNSEISFEKFKTETLNDLKIQYYLQTSINPKFDISEDDIKKYYEINKKQLVQPESFKLKHILVKFKSPKPSASDEKNALEKAKKLKEMLDPNGTNFSEIAKQHSDCPSAERGGDLGVVAAGTTVPEFELGVRALQPNQISDPVRTEYGYHIIRLSEKIPAKEFDFNEAKPRVIAALRSLKQNEAIQKKVEELRAAADIKILIK
ncbi:MAG TPA: peptidylprolyl isomerase [Oligoflexia bacterium]|nr:peptidylprolyl isomerase [Oligoflexia bacterium]HMP27242.1 peptidylprolyl isomerase [Oligoflexia bacterium]